MSLPFLFEIGTEEIPDWMIEPALADLKRLFEELCRVHRLGGVVERVDATPRRLALRAHGIAVRQAEERRELVGPPVAAGGAAAQGFAKKLGVTVDQLERVSTPKGEYYRFLQLIPARPAKEILAEHLPSVIAGISFPKTMYWTGKGGPRFIRPIRWLVAVLGDEIVPFTFAGVHSGDTTVGHRVLGARSIRVNYSSYESLLEKNGVILDAQRRRARIEEALTPDVRRDEALLKTLVYLTEFPTPIRGRFDARYLRLPDEVLSTVMRHHQKYFSVGDPRGGLKPEFVAVMNIDADPEGLVRQGNERVLRARFNDARFFWDTDLKVRLEDRLPELAKITFQAKLGSYLEKTNRNVALAREFAQALRAELAPAERAALLAKCDLTTSMVKEFTELQGIMGGLYAREQGEPEPVWQAIYDHYRPESMEDPIPRTLTGQIVALADKTDTLRGCFGIGLIPSGSKDPFALRRAAQGVIKILAEGQLSLPLSRLAHNSAELLDFFADRVRYYFKEVRGFRYDEVNAAMAAGFDDVPDLGRRLEALRLVRPTENFEPLAASFKRIQNILRQAEVNSPGTVNPTLLEPGPEASLWERFLLLRDRVEEARRQGDYRTALQAIASLRPAIDLFFDKVLVNAPDPAVRQNRLNLLAAIRTEFSSIADFSEIVTG
jgi:glycyl-tRNA synthetase beta chain